MAETLREKKRAAASPATVALIVKTMENVSLRSVIDSQKLLLRGMHLILSSWMVRACALLLLAFGLVLTSVTLPA